MENLLQIQGFKGTYEQFPGTDAGKLSAYNAGLLKFKEGKYQEALRFIRQVFF